MTKTFAVDENNDLYLDQSGNIAIVAGLEAVLQTCARAAKAQRGEMIFQIDAGIPNFQMVWNGSPNLLQFEAALRATLLQVAGVVEIITINTAIVSDTLTYVVTILTKFGQGLINGNLQLY